MNAKCQSRRDFLAAGTVLATAAGGLAGVPARAAEPPDPRKTRSYNPDMVYRRLGKTNLMVSAVCLGGHWKRLMMLVPTGFKGPHWLRDVILDDPDFRKNRYDVVSRCIEKGINYIDACTGPECIAYSRALRGRRESVYLGWSWYEKEARFPDWRSADKLMQGLDEGLRETQQEYVDLWRITINQDRVHSPRETEEIIEALYRAKKQGKARFTGVSTHNRAVLAMLFEYYPNEIDAVCTPYTADSKGEAPATEGQLFPVGPREVTAGAQAAAGDPWARASRHRAAFFDAALKYDVGIFGIKPFASHAIFKGDGNPKGPHVEEDNRLARLTIRYILENKAITAPIPGLASVEEVDNVALAIQEYKQQARLSPQERSEVARVGKQMWERLPQHYQWLMDWRYV